MNTTVYCRMPWEGFNVLYDGKVKCCCWSNVVVGRIDLESIEAIWNGNKFSYVREMMASGHLEAICPSWCPRLLDGAHNTAVPHGFSPVFNHNLDTINREIGINKIAGHPIDFRIFPTSRCNLRCIMCGQDHSPFPEFSKQFQKDLSQYYPYIRTILAAGGEPLLSQDFKTLVVHFPHQDFPDCKFRVITNGTLFDDSFLRQMPGKFDQIGISIDSIDPIRFEQIRRGASWEVVTRNIEKIANLQGRDFELYLLFTIMKTNYAEIPSFIQFAKNMGAIPSLNPVLDDWHGQHIEGYERKAVLEILDQIADNDASHVKGCRKFFEDQISNGINLSGRK